MKASELVDALTKGIKEHGDGDVKIATPRKDVPVRGCEALASYTLGKSDEPVKAIYFRLL